MTTQSIPNRQNLTDKEWLDLAWKYFQQHAQQRVSYFNFFVVFSTLLFGAYVATFNSTNSFPIIGCLIGGVQAFISYCFFRIELRNKFLTKLGEEAIKQIEVRYKETGGLELFSKETSATATHSKSARLHNRMFSHGSTYRLLYWTFGLAGVLCGLLSVFYALYR
jgi:hypothetical protein